MKYLPVGAIIISLIIAINEMFWIGKTSFAWVVIGLALAIIFVSVYQLTDKRKE